MSDAPAAPTDEEKPIHREGFSRPETLFEKIGYASSTWLGRAGIVVVLLLVLFGIIVGVPMWRVAGAPSYRAAKQFLIDSPGVAEEIGEVIRIDTIPSWYRLSPDRAEFRRVLVEGEITSGRANLVVTNAAGVWTVTSASFVGNPYTPGAVRQRKVLVDGSSKTR